MAITYLGGDTAGGNTASLTLTFPPGDAAGDVGYIFWTMSATAVQTVDPPAGWVAVANNANSTGAPVAKIYRRVWDGTEGASVAIAMTGATRHSAVLVVYRGVNTTTPEDSSPAVDTTHTTGTTHNNPPETTVAANCVIVTSIHERATSIDTGWTPPTGYTERGDTLTLSTGSAGTITAVADDLTPQAAGATVTPPVWTGDHVTGINTIVTYTLALRPVTVGTSPSPLPRIRHLLVR